MEPGPLRLIIMHAPPYAWNESPIFSVQTLLVVPVLQDLDPVKQSPIFTFYLPHNKYK